MFRSLSPWLHCVIAPNPVLLIILPSLLCFFSPFPSTIPRSFLCLSAHVCACTSWICLRGEEGATKSVERTWQLLFSLSLHCFGPPQILFHGAKHPLPGISTAPISRRRFKPLSWHPDWAWREKACDAHQHRQKQQTHLLSLLREGPASCSVCSAYSHHLGLTGCSSCIHSPLTWVRRVTHEPVSWFPQTPAHLFVN